MVTPEDISLAGQIKTITNNGAVAFRRDTIIETGAASDLAAKFPGTGLTKSTV
jgi:hypothetical protein